jgi:ceramide glucosyltransferase
MLQRRVLEEIGGLQPLVTQLAEDNVLGQRVRGLGLTVRLANIVSAVTVPEASFRALWQHEIRWARTIRGLVPIAHAVSTFQHPLFSAVMASVLSGAARWSVALFAFAWVVRAISARGIDCALLPRLGRRAIAAPYWLLPLRDTLSVVETIASYWGNEVVWRGHKLTAAVGAPKLEGGVPLAGTALSLTTHAPRRGFTRDG